MALITPRVNLACLCVSKLYDEREWQTMTIGPNMQSERTAFQPMEILLEFMQSLVTVRPHHKVSLRVFLFALTYNSKVPAGVPWDPRK